jgi:hypothetical protein
VVVDDSGGTQTSTYQPKHRASHKGKQPSEDGVKSNARLTGATAVVLLILLAVEGATLLGIRAHLDVHVFVGMLLIPPVLLKIGSTTWRFARYYSGSPPYRRKGPPPAVLRLLGPVLVVLTVILLASGVALVLSPHALGGRLLFIHKASFFLWVAAMTIHVLGHIVETARLAPLDLGRRTRAQVAGASARQWSLVAALAVGSVLGVVMLGPTATYLHHHGGFFHP